jgi:hypothetical protein
LRKSWLIFAAISLALLIQCGKKGPPVPKGLPVPTTIDDFRGDVKDGLLFLSFTIPTKNRDGTPVTNLGAYAFMKNCGPCGGDLTVWKIIGLTDAKGYTIRDGRFWTYDNDVRAGMTYSYRVYPVTVKGTRLDGSNVLTIVWKNPPGPPGEAAAKGEDGKVLISWRRRGALNNVYRWEDDTYPLFPLNPAPLADSHYTDGGLQNGKTYRFEVRAVRMDGATPLEGRGIIVSGTPRDMTPPAPPANLKLETKDGGVLLAFTPPPEEDVAGYNVYRIVAGKPERANQAPVTEPRFVDARPGANLRYVSYYVTAVDREGNESEPSREQIIILKDIGPGPQVVPGPEAPGPAGKGPAGPGR